MNSSSTVYFRSLAARVCFPARRFRNFQVRAARLHAAAAALRGLFFCNTHSSGLFSRDGIRRRCGYFEFAGKIYSDDDELFLCCVSFSPPRELFTKLHQQQKLAAFGCIYYCTFSARREIARVYFRLATRILKRLVCLYSAIFCCY